MYINGSNTALSVAVWLATDTYDHNKDESVISVTSVIKPLKQIILSRRAAKNGVVEPVEISNLVASRMGTAFHDGIENAWLNHYQAAMKKLGYPQRVIDLIRINPEAADLFEDCIPIYLERRSEKEKGEFKISGKFDFVGDGRVEDFKSTGVYTYTQGTNDWKQIMQGSIYRWLNPDIITDDTMAIQYIFTDWSKNKAMSDKNYPQSRIVEKRHKLLSIEDTDQWLSKRVADIIRLMDAPESDIPECTQEELWQSKPVYKYYANPNNTGRYYANPNKTGRATKNFDNQADAHLHLATKGKGIVIKAEGEVKMCKYCPAFNFCTQKDRYIQAGLIKP